MKTLLHIALYIFILFPIAISSQDAFAQFGSIGEDVLKIELEPRYPKPGDEFTARFANYSGDDTGTITWIIDGEVEDDMRGQSTIRLRAPLLGTPIRIEARAESGIGARTAFAPSSVDIITESNSSAPYFYKGRRVPSLGGTMRIVAIPNLFTEKGTRVPPDAIKYTWRVDNQIIGDARGPVLTRTGDRFGTSLIFLTLDAPQYATTYETAFYGEEGEPVLAFYVHNPLNGLSRNAIQNKYLETEKEITLKAQPYFMPQNALQNSEYTWAINGTPTQNQNTDPYLITLQGEGGFSDIGFSLQNILALSNRVEGIFRVVFK